MIYVVEDDSGIRELVVYTLRSTGYEAEGFTDGSELFRVIDGTTPELIMLDIMLPGDDGITILKKLKNSAATRDIPVIMATAKGTEYDRVSGLDLGADDYLCKPFGMMEMVSRVRAVLRRTSPKDSSVISVGGITVDQSKHTVTAGGEKIMLTLKEFDLLYALMRSPRRVFTRDALLEEIWGMGYDGETRTVDVHIRTLRMKLGTYGDIIETVRGVGYRLEVR